MKYTVYQIPFPTNKEEEKIYHRYAFAHLDWIDKVHFKYYKETYSGDIDTQNTKTYQILDDIFRELNLNHPADYKGHSLSVSDIILIDGHYYYCDAYSWEEINI